MDNQPESVDNLGTWRYPCYCDGNPRCDDPGACDRDAPGAPDTPNVSDPSPTIAPMTGLVTETHLMKAGEVRDLLHIGRTTLHDWRTAGRLQGIRHTPNGPWYYPANQDLIRAALRAVGSLR